MIVAENMLSALDDHVASCAQKLAQAERDRDRFIAQHCAENPLSDALVAEMAERVLAGGALCCKAGRAWLKGRVDAVWARVLNTWAQDNLSCSDKDPWHLRRYAQRVSERQFEPGKDQS